MNRPAQGIPEWAVAALSGYSPVQIQAALQWAMQNLDAVQLCQYYDFAKYYRPAMRRELQGLVDQMGQLVEEKMRYSHQGMGYGLGQYGDFDGSVPPPPPPNGAGGSSNPWGDIAQGIKMGLNIVNQGIKTAQNINCAANPNQPGCPNYRPPHTNVGGNQQPYWGPPPQQPPQQPYYPPAPPQGPGGGYQDHSAASRVPRPAAPRPAAKVPVRAPAATTAKKEQPWLMYAALAAGAYLLLAK